MEEFSCYKVIKEYPWDDFVKSCPIKDVRTNIDGFFNKRVLYLTRDSLKSLVNHPAMVRHHRMDWKLLFYVDDVRESCNGFDYIEVEVG